MFLLYLLTTLFTVCPAFLIDESVHGSASFFWDFKSLDNPARNLVNALRDQQDCTSIYEACANFTTVIHDKDISYKAVHELSDTFRNNFPAVPVACTCHGEPQFWQRVELDDHGNCYKYDSNYKRIYDHFFGHGRNTKLGCNTHRSLWHGLVAVTNRHHGNPNLCQWGLIREISTAYSKFGSGCQCSAKSVAPCSTPTTTTHSTTQRTTERTTQPTVTAAVSYQIQGCDKFKVIESVGKAVPVVAKISSCTDASQASSDALVTDSCTVGETATWRKGNNVMSMCNSGTIQPYTAIATFPPNSDTFQTAGNIAAVLVKCETNGIEIAFQDCGQAPILKHLTTGFGQLDPNNYYTIAV